MNKLSLNETNQSLLQLFNIVIEDTDTVVNSPRYDLQSGTVLSGHFSTKLANKVTEFALADTVNDSDLIKTFYKSWTDITDKTRLELYLDQVVHYMTTYGQLKPGFMYIPNEDFDVELPNAERAPVRVITTVTRDAAINRITEFLDSGIALEEATLTTLITLLRSLEYVFAGTFANKEANIYVARLTGTLPSAAEEFLRYVIFNVTESTLLIKNPATILALKESNYNYKHDLEAYIKQNDIVELAKVFNRFKPLFLAMKKDSTRSIINKIAKLSKTAHEPMVQSALNFVTSKEIAEGDMHWLTNATTFALLRSLNAIALASNNPTDMTYRVRNGKMFTKVSNVKYNDALLQKNTIAVMNELKSRVNGSGKTVYIPENVDYALPTSEKSFVGNLPALTKFTGDTLNVGMFWKNSDGASDLDLSTVDINGGKVGWNSRYNAGGVTYSGDITNAPNGAAEYMRFAKGCGQHIVHLNVYTGEANSKYDLIVGNTSKKVSSKKVMDPKNLITTARKETRNMSSILGFVDATGDNVEFIATDFDGGVHTVSGDSDYSAITLKSLLFKNKHSLRLATILDTLGYTVVNTKEEDITVDLSVNNLNKDAILDLFK